MAVGTKGRIAPGLLHRLASLAGETDAYNDASTQPITVVEESAVEKPTEGLGPSACVAVITTVRGMGSSSCIDVTPLPTVV